MASPSSEVTLHAPSKYTTTATTTKESAPVPSTPSPPLEWLHRTWIVTHSTLAMWRSARNVRITYKALPAKEADGRPRVDDLVEYEPISSEGKLKTVSGVDTAASGGKETVSWDWRGSGWLFFVTSHWEVLGWGERKITTKAAGREGGSGEEKEEVERWAVTWFAPTVFTKEGLDIYCDRKEGLSEETYGMIDKALREMGVEGLKEMVQRDMRPVEIRMPWVEY